MRGNFWVQSCFSLRFVPVLLTRFFGGLSYTPVIQTPNSCFTHGFFPTKRFGVFGENVLIVNTNVPTEFSHVVGVQ